MRMKHSTISKRINQMKIQMMQLTKKIKKLKPHTQ
jgi:hypothetical protein